LTPAAKREKKKIPLPLKRVRKEIPPPSKSFKDKKTYNRKRAKEELDRTINETSRLK